MTVPVHDHDLLVSGLAGNIGDMGSKGPFFTGHDQHNLIGKGMGEAPLIFSCTQIAPGSHHFTIDHVEQPVLNGQVITFDAVFPAYEQVETCRRPGQIRGRGQAAAG